MITGVPAHVDGRMLAITERAGGRIVNRDRMWHYTEGLQNWDPIWPGHGIRILPGPVLAVVRRHGQAVRRPRLPRLRHPRHAGVDHGPPATTTPGSSLTQKIIEKEFALSGSEQNPDLTGKDISSPCPGSGQAPRRRSRRSRRTAPTSWSPRRCRSWSPG